MTNEGVRLGDLLTQAGMLKPEELREAMQIAKHQSLPVGRVLIMSGYVSDAQLRSAVQAQSLLKDGLIELALVVQALTIVGKEEITLDQALERIGFVPPTSQTTNKLGELLMEAGLVARETLDQALEQASQAGLPLGRILLHTGSVVEPLLSIALNAQILVRDKKISREQAVHGLKAARERQISLEQSLAENGLHMPVPTTIKLGELLVAAGLVQESALMDYVELGLVLEKPIGQIFIQQGVISEPVLSAALELQKYVSEGKLGAPEAGQALNMVAKNGVSVNEAIATTSTHPPAQPEVLFLYQFLQLAGHLSPKHIEEAIRAGTQDALIMAQMLKKAGAIEERLLSAALGCNEFMKHGILNVEQAIVAFNCCHQNNTCLEDAFNQLGWFLNQPYTNFTQHSTLVEFQSRQAQRSQVPSYREALPGTDTQQLTPVASDSEFVDDTGTVPDSPPIAQAFVPPPPPGYTPLPEMQANAAYQEAAPQQPAPAPPPPLPPPPQPQPAQEPAPPQVQQPVPQPQPVQQQAVAQPSVQEQQQTGFELGAENAQPDGEHDSDKPRKRLIDLIPGKRPDAGP